MNIKQIPKTISPFLLLVMVFLPLKSVATASSDESRHRSAEQIVLKIQHADYAGDLVSLRTLYEALTPFLESQEMESRIRYWRGFAMWRRAINQMNDPKPDIAGISKDLEIASEEFGKALAIDPSFDDARISQCSCLIMLSYYQREDTVRSKVLKEKAIPLGEEAYANAPSNPRVIWVRGVGIWWTPVEKGGGQQKAIESYEQGLDLSRKQPKSTDALEPSWGEPEMLMSLAWCHLNKTNPDPALARQYAVSALQIVPNWHYVRDILLVQIDSAIQAK